MDEDEFVNKFTNQISRQKYTSVLRQMKRSLPVDPVKKHEARLARAKADIRRAKRDGLTFGTCMAILEEVYQQEHTLISKVGT